MLATPWPSAFDSEDWWFEVKWDGYRCVASGRGDHTAIRSRRGLDLAGRFPGVAALPLPPRWVVDGEIVVFDHAGRPDFSSLQAGAGAATYVVFDLLVAAGEEVFSAPFEERRRRLAEAPLPESVIVTEPVAGNGRALYSAVRDRGLEGIVAKRAQSPYLPGKRSPDWRKVALRRTMRAVVGGWLPGEGGRAGSFGSLLIGLWAEEGRSHGHGLVWVGAVGSGFTDSQLGPVASALGEIERSTCPFSDPSPIPRRARWVEPGIVISVEFKEWTRDRRLRAPVFKGVDDTPPDEVTWEREGPGRT